MEESIPIPRIVRGDVEQRRVEKRPYSVRDDFPVEALRTYSQAESSTESRARSVVPTPLATESRANRERTPRSRSPRNTEQGDLGNLADDTEEGSLLETWKRNKVSGPGVEVLERSQDRQTLLAFLANDRLEIPMAKKYVTKNDNKEARGKTLNYEREDKEIREGLDISRRTEWEKWRKFVAGRPCRGAELKSYWMRVITPYQRDG